MDIRISDFKNTAKNYIEALKHIDSGTIVIPTYPHGSGLKDILSLSSIRVKNMAKLYQVVKHVPVAIRQISAIFSQKTLPFPVAFKDIDWRSNNKSPFAILDKDNIKKFDSTRLMPEALYKHERPFVLQYPPYEHTEGDNTYRMLLTYQDGISMLETMYKDTDKLYDYLDEGNYYMRVARDVKGKIEKAEVMSDAYDINTAHVFLLCKVQPNLAALLRNGCFIPRQEAEILKLRMLKKLTPLNKVEYDMLAALIDTDYKKNSTLVLLDKLLAGTAAKATINNVEFTKNTAVYENITIESEGLLDLLYKKINFNSEFDIYTVCTEAGKAAQKILDAAARPLSDKLTVKTLNINNIPIVLELAHTGQRYINGVRVNMDEIDQAIARASCYTDENKYKLFLKNISRLSIKHHDIISNGLQVKIHSNISHDEYNNSVPGGAAPALKFHIDKETKRVQLDIGDNRSIPVHFQKLIDKVRTVNTRANNKMTRGTSTHRGNFQGRVNRDWRWAANQMVDILIESCTFDESVEAEDGTVATTTKVLISKEDVKTLLRMANDSKLAAIARSREFMESAVKATGAERVEFMGKPAYKIQGKLRTYAVIIQTAKVYDYETKQYRCIVNSHNYHGAGYDDVATRLLALKNDSVMQGSIGTLRGEAQPEHEPRGAMNFHDREVVDDELIDRRINDAFVNASR